MQSVLFSLVGGFLGGVLVRSLVLIHPGLALAVSAIGAAGAIVFRRRAGGLALIFVALAASGAGIIRMDLSDSPPDAQLSAREGARIALLGTVSAEPDVRESFMFVTLGGLRLKRDGTGGTLEDNVLLRAPPYLPISYGDELSVSGILKAPEPFEGDGGRVVDYPSFLALRGIRFIVDDPDIEIIRRGGGDPVRAWLFSAKHSLSRAAERVVPAPESALLGGILFGSQEGMPDETSESFRRAGIIHIVVLSGYNLSVVADWVLRASKFLPGPAGYALAAIAIVAYAAMAGASATAVRAAIMAVIVILSHATRRRYDAGRALALAALAMVAANPRILVSDRSFQLSFLATVAVVYVAPHIEARLRRIPEALGVRGIVASTIATQVFLLPFLLYMSGSFSMTALLANLLALPAVPAAMLSGMATAVLSLVHAPLAHVPGLLSDLLLSWIIGVGSVLGAPYAAFTVPAFPFAWTMAAYAVFFIALARAGAKRYPPSREGGYS